MPLFGSHMSIAGGYFKAVEAAKAIGCDCVQIFTKNNNQWAGKPITHDEAQLFKSKLTELQIRAPLSHSSYLINVASPEAALRQKSIEAMVVELQRAHQLGIPYVVLHPGSFTSSSEPEGLAAAAKSLSECFRQTRDLPTVCLLENTAGQGSNLGWRFEQLAAIISQCKFPDRLDLCIDTCHLFAAGYPVTRKADYDNTIRELDRVLGLKRVKAIHLNDSKSPFGSRKDRHEHIGHGAMGLDAFRNFVTDPRFAKVPMYLETDKGQWKGEEWDVINLRTLRALVDGSPIASISSSDSANFPEARASKPAKKSAVRTDKSKRKYNAAAPSPKPKSAKKK